MPSNERIHMDIAEAKPIIHPLVESFAAEHFEVLVTGVCTEDGFVIAHRDGRKFTLEEDKVAALSSTLLSLSEAAARVINSGKLQVTLVEADKANLVVVKTQFRELEVVLTVAAESSMSVGQALFLANRLAGEIRRL